MENKRKRFYVCGNCGQTMFKKTKPRKCWACDNKDIGELQIKWK